MLIAREGDTTTLGAEGPVKLKNPPAGRPGNPKNLFLHNPSTQPAASAAPPFLKSAPEGRHHHPLNPLNLLNPMNPGRGAAPLN